MDRKRCLKYPINDWKKLHKRFLWAWPFFFPDISQTDHCVKGGSGTSRYPVMMQWDFLKITLSNLLQFDHKLSQQVTTELMCTSNRTVFSKLRCRASWQQVMTSSLFLSIFYSSSVILCNRKESPITKGRQFRSNSLTLTWKLYDLSILWTKNWKYQKVTL